MSLADCFGKIKQLDQQDVDLLNEYKDKYIKEGMPELEAENKAIQTYSDLLFSEMNNLRQELGIKKLPKPKKPIMKADNGVTFSSNEQYAKLNPDTRFQKTSPEVSSGKTFKSVDNGILTVAEGFGAKEESTFIPLRDDVTQEISDYHKNAVDARNNPEVIKSYRAFMDDTLAQFNSLVDAGYELRPWMGEGEPYASSKDMIKDVRDNKRLYYLRSVAATGSNTDQEVEDYILFEDTQIEIDGERVLFNDLFRAVHDVFGHAMKGNSFSPQGEMNAYVDHSEMYSDGAQNALALETMMYNFWYKHNKSYSVRKLYSIPQEILDKGRSQGAYGEKYAVRFQKTGQQNADFFTGKAAKASSEIPYSPVLKVDQSSPVGKSYLKFTDGGNFTGHISKMIAGFAEKQKQVAEAIVKADWAKTFLDVGTSEGGLVKTVAENRPDMTVTGIDPNPTMMANFNKTPAVENAEYRLEALGASWTEADGTKIKEFKAKTKFDVVNEDFVFQFISPDRHGQVEMIKDMMAPNGVFVTSGKFHTSNKEANEAKKYDHQKNYFDQSQLTEDKQTIVSGMSDDMVNDVFYAEVLTHHFNYVQEFWNAGNFKGYIASDNLGRLNEIKSSVGDLSSEFSDPKSDTPELITSNKIRLVEEINKLRSSEESGVTLNVDGTKYEGGGVIVAVESKNITEDSDVAKAIDEFVLDNRARLHSSLGTPKLGLFKLDDKTVSVDLNLVLPKSGKGIAEEFAKWAGQESIYDMDSKELTNTGATGLNPKTFTDEQFRDIAESLAKQELPQFIQNELIAEAKAQIQNGGPDKTVFRGSDNRKYNAQASFDSESIKIYHKGSLAAYLHDGDVYVNDNHKRNNVAERVYDFAEKAYGKPFTRSEEKSEGSRDGFQPIDVRFKKEKKEELDTTKYFEGVMGAYMNDDGKGNFVFNHYGPDGLKETDPNKFGTSGSLKTGKDEVLARKGKGVTFFYTNDSDSEFSMLTTKYEVRIPKNKVYPFNADPLNLFDEAKAAFQNDFPGQAFGDPNTQLAYITDVAIKRGFDMVVARWNLRPNSTVSKKRVPIGLRAETSKKLDLRNVSKPQSIPTRVTNAANKYLNPEEYVSIDAIKEASTIAYIKVAKTFDPKATWAGKGKGDKKLTQYPLAYGLRSPITAKAAEKNLEVVIERMKSNLRFLYDNYREDLRDVTADWYKGANKYAKDFALKYDLTEEQASGIIAVLSPQKDWNMNVAIGDAIMHVLTTQQETVFSDEMANYFINLPIDEKNKTKAQIAAKKALTLSVANNMKGKKLKDLEEYEQAIFARVYDEVTNDRSYPILSPEGVRLKMATSNNGKLSTYAYSGYSTIAKAVSIFNNKDFLNISEQLGNQHKVRNFYNNIIDPTDGTSVTIDTHAVAAAELLPIGGNSPQVTNNFGKGMTNAATGIRGTYAVYTEAYRQLADELGILPRELQSITWEAARGMFDNKKGDIDSVINDTWSKFTGDNLNDIQNEILEKTGGIKDPDWAGERFDSTVPSQAEDASNQGELGDAGSTPRGRTGGGTSSVEVRKQKADPFYSNSIQALDHISQPKATGDQWKQMLLNNGAVQAELDWMGFDDFIKENPRATRDQVLDFLTENQVEIVEIEKGAESSRARIEYLKSEMAKIERDAQEYAKNSSAKNEDEFSDIVEDYLLDTDHPVMAAEIDDLESGGDGYGEIKDAPKYAEYTLKGGENYKEVLLTMAPKAVKQFFEPVKNGDKWLVGEDSFSTRVEAENHADTLSSSNKKDVEGYKSSHWNEPNILAHIRFNERVLDNAAKKELSGLLGKLGANQPTVEQLERGRALEKEQSSEKVLFIEEIQSDWAQEGRKKGFNNDAQNEYTVRKLNQETYGVFQNGNLVSELISEEKANERIEQLKRDKPKSSVPQMPFPQTQQWVNLTLRRMIQHAAENGFDRIAWVNGQQSTERYDLSKQVDEIKWYEVSDGYIINGFKDNSSIFNERTSREKLPDLVGKELADKIIKRQGFESVDGSGKGKGTLSGDRLKVGGEGMESFYDKILPAQAKKVLAKIDKGIQLEVIEMGTSKSVVVEDAISKFAPISTGQELGQQLSFKVSEVMKAKAIEFGMPMFQKQINGDETFDNFDQKYDYIVRKMQDKSIYLKRLLEAKMNGSKIPDELNFYAKENLAKGRVKVRYDEFQSNIMTPWLNFMKSLAISDKVGYEEMSEYYKAKHIVMDNIEKGGINRVDAIRMVNQLEAKLSKEKIKQLNDYMRMATSFELQMRREYGLISASEFKNTIKMFTHYVPLRGWKSIQYLDPTRFTGNQTRKGRETESADPISYVDVMIRSALHRGEQNLIKKSFLDFVKRFPDSKLYTINGAWYIKTEKGWDIHTDGMDETLQKALKEKRAQQKPPDIESLNAADLQRLEARWNTLDRDEQSIAVMADGVKTIIKVKDPAITRAFKNTNYEQLNFMLRTMRRAVDYLRGVYTQYSPEFAMRNFVRDVTSGIINIRNDFGNAIAAKVIAEVGPRPLGAAKQLGKKRPFKAIATATGGKAMATVQRGFRGDYSGKDGQLFKQFIMLGGLTGYSDIAEVSKVYEDLSSKVNGFAGTNKTKLGRITMIPVKSIQKSLDFIDDANRVVENTVRFAAFKVLMETGVDGMTPQRAALYAKDITVNFNRKGELSDQLGSIYLFFNAAVQGIERTYVRPMQDPKTRKRAITSFAALAAVNVAVSSLARMIGGEDDDGLYFYDKLPEYIRTHNIVIPNILSPEEGEFFMIPLPYGHHAFYASGEHLVGGLLHRKESPADVLGGLLMTFSEGASPLGAPQTENMTMEQSMTHYVTPMVMKPVLDLAFNTNFAGGKIYKEPFLGNDSSPSSQRYFSNVSPIIRSATDFLNEVSGGNKIEPGLIDVNPEKVEHIVETYTGGVGKFVSNSVYTAIAAYKGEMFSDENGRKVPFIRNYYTKETGKYHDQARFYDAVNDIKDVHQRYKEYSGVIASNPEMKDDFKSFIEENRKKIMLYDKVSKTGGYVDQLKTIREMKRVAEVTNNKSRTEMLEERERIIYNKLFENYKE